MSLGREQEAFARDVQALLAFIHNLGLRVRIGEAQRPVEMQAIYVRDGRSRTMNSQHIKKLAIDLFIFKEGKLLDKHELQHVGDFWESIDEQNSWGGNWHSFKDVPHFERRV